MSGKLENIIWNSQSELTIIKEPLPGSFAFVALIIFRLFKWTSSFSSWKAFSRLKAFNYLNFLENNLNTVNALEGSASSTGVKKLAIFIM